MSKADRRLKDVSAFMGPGTELEGELVFTGSVHLDCKVTGRISSSQGLLIIGPEAQIQADVEVDSAIICGEVHGEVVASRRIELKPPARVHGTLTSPELVIHEGVVFEGTSQMGQTVMTTGQKGKVAILGAEGGARVG